MASKDVVLVGIRSNSCGPGFMPALRADGFNLIEAPGPENLPDILQEHAGATIVVYNRPREDTARRTLATLSAVTRHIPVIVLVDLATFEEYYDFMCRGAFDYFELEEDPVAIERAIRYASQEQTRPAARSAVA